MAHEVTRFEAATNPPSVHPTLRDAVTAEIAVLVGSRSDESGTPLIARLIVDRAPQVIACLAQLPEANPVLQEPANAR